MSMVANTVMSTALMCTREWVAMSMVELVDTQVLSMDRCAMYTLDLSTMVLVMAPTVQSTANMVPTVQSTANMAPTVQSTMNMAASTTTMRFTMLTDTTSASLFAVALVPTAVQGLIAVQAIAA
ncbi:hypothetical protein IW137_002814 [Coemansia sp. RSA 1287]|nr:hypothetical protein IW137_002814 [Coemansia sp. RSA 1287]